MLKPTTNEYLISQAHKLRQKTFEAFVEHGEAHLGGSFSMIELLIALYEVILNENDKFILSIPFIISILFLFPLKDLGFKLFAYDLSVNLKNSKKLTELNSTLIKTVRAHFLICIILSIILVI